jgi:hypothetical protein
MQSCIFCGAQQPVHNKLLSHAFVSDIVQRQIDAGISEPIVNFLCSYITAETHRIQETQAKNEIEAPTVIALNDNEDANSCNGDEEHENTYFNSCMCCYYWISRRQKQQLIPLPMQNLLWFAQTLTGCEKKKCDSRILLRLVKTITESGNMYARFFEAEELQAMLQIKERWQNADASVSKQGDNSFCVKKQLASVWHSNNGESILIAHAQAADLLR